ncbi:MAG: tRNA (adenosine(37)-N6)-dimethylallyltransferase MiaA [Muribaculaceae bacterium]|nr:tRNA (adenosine(37)-N6)-dimethylallyltransferase MiaA [Muribaculaceae bacterium]
MPRPFVIVVTGATASGKTAVAIAVAERLGCEIISADSRQIYAGIPITTAAPTPEELARVKHHFVGTLPLDAYYSAAKYEEDVTALLPELFKRHGCAVVCGGSMLYIDAVTDGIDSLPTISDSVRSRVLDIMDQHGLPGALALLENLDPEYAVRVDRSNPRRVAHALEICMQAGVPYSSLRTAGRVNRDFDIIKVAVDRPRAELFDRINRRVEQMVADGMVEEARGVYPLRHLNSLNTVGFKEMFAMFDGKMDRRTALDRLAKNTRVYAKKQLTWLARPGVRPARFVNPDTAAEDILRMVSSELNA